MRWWPPASSIFLRLSLIKRTGAYLMNPADSQVAGRCQNIMVHWAPRMCRTASGSPREAGTLEISVRAAVSLNDCSPFCFSLEVHRGRDAKSSASWN